MEPPPYSPTFRTVGKAFIPDIHPAEPWQTRSGSTFSPWGGLVVGAPLQAPPTFDLQAQVSLAIAQGDAVHYAEGAAAAAELDPDDPAIVGGTTTEDVNEPPPKHPAPLPPSLASPGGGRRGVKRPATDVGAHDGSESRAEPGDGLEPTISKAKYHAKRRKKEARNAKRQGPDAVAGMNRPIKTIARRHATPHLLLSLPAIDLARLLENDNASGPGRADAPIQTNFSTSMADVRVASTAFQGVRYNATQAERNALELAHFERMGFEYVAWDGQTTIPFLDRDGRLVVLLQGAPGDHSEWMRDVNEPISQLCEELREAYGFKKSVNRRVADDFKAINFGISFGGGQQRVGRLAQGSHYNYALVDAIRNHPAFLRVANFANAGLQLFWPRLYAFYEDMLSGIISRDPDLTRNFTSNVYASATVNVGPRTVTARHYDHLNIPFGFCSITAFGTFNPKTGGHIILWELKKVVEFPPASTIQILSAVISHSNLGIGPEERRYSFTQYTAGGLFRWWECGYQTYKSFVAAGKKFKRTGLQRWNWGVDLLGKWGDIKHLFEK